MLSPGAKLLVLAVFVASASTSMFLALPRTIPRAPPSAPPVRVAVPSRAPMAEAAELLATGDLDDARRRFDRARERARIRLSATPRGPVAWSADGSRAAMQAGSEVVVVSVGDWRELARINAGFSAQFALNKDGSLLELCRSTTLADENATLELVRVDTGELVGIIPHARRSNAVVFSDDGKLFVGHTRAEGPCDHAVVWDVEARAVRQTLPRPGAEHDCLPMDHVELTAGDTLLKTASNEGKELTWSLATGAVVATREGAVEVGPDGIGVYFRRGQLSHEIPKRLDVKTSRELGELASKDCLGAAGSLFGPKGGALATFDKSHLCLWDPRTPRLLGTIDVERLLRRDEVRFTSNGEAWVIGVTSEDASPIERARTFSATNAALIEDLGTVTFLGASDDGLLFHDARAHELVRVRGARPAERTPLDVRSAKLVLPSDRPPPTRSLEPWRDEPRTLELEASNDGLALLDGKTGKVDSIAAEPGAWQVSSSPDRRWLVGFDDKSHARVWDVERRRAVRSDAEAQGSVNLQTFAATKDALTFTIGLREGRLDLATGALTYGADEPSTPAPSDPVGAVVSVNGKTFELHPSAPKPTFVLFPGMKLDPGVSRIQMTVLASAVSDDGRSAAAIFAHGDGVVDNDWSCEVRTFELPSGRETRRFPSQSRIYALGYYDGGRLLLGTGYDDGGGAWLWETRTGKLLFKNEMNVRSASVVGHGARLVLVSTDGALEIWDVEKHAELVEPFGDVVRFDVSADAELLAAEGRGVLRVFDSNGALLHRYPTPAGLADPDGLAFVGDKGELLALSRSGAASFVRVADGTIALSMRFGEDSALAFADGSVELFGAEEHAMGFARCYLDGFGFPLGWCLAPHRKAGLLAGLLAGR